MSNLTLNLQGISDQVVRDNLQKIQDFLNLIANAEKKFQALTISVTDNAASAKINHNLGSIPTDAIITRLISPSAAKLTLDYSSFTKEFVFYDVTGLNAGDTLEATVFLGNTSDLVTLLEKALVMSSGSLA